MLADKPSEAVLLVVGARRSRGRGGRSDKRREQPRSRSRERPHWQPVALTGARPSHQRRTGCHVPSEVEYVKPPGFDLEKVLPENPYWSCCGNESFSSRGCAVKAHEWKRQRIAVQPRAGPGSEFDSFHFEGLWSMQFNPGPDPDRSSIPSILRAFGPSC